MQTEQQLIILLKEQIEFLKKQIEVKDKQIFELINLINNPFGHKRA